MGTLYIVSTPIGNLKDITLRALDTLRDADLILCEDTRVTRKLLDHYTISKETLSYHQHSRESRIREIIDLIRSGKNIALVCDAGTPGISDPGNKLVNRLINESVNQVKIIPIPGPSALATAASISGFPMDKFVFLGYPPTKKKRKKFFQEIASSHYPVIFYESPHRIIKTLNELREAVGGERSAVVGRELTKKFESVYRGSIAEVFRAVERDVKKGEYTIIIEGV